MKTINADWLQQHGDRLWADETLRNSLLWLQSEQQLEPSLVLLLLALYQQDCCLTAAHAAVLKAQLHSWSLAVLQPLRAIRQAAKGQLAEGDYQALLSSELTLERHGQQLLLQALPSPLSVSAPLNGVDSHPGYEYLIDIFQAWELTPQQWPEWVQAPFKAVVHGH
ncbi:MAG: DUF2390 domain-containing protein [Ferrimonas sp.]